MEKLRGHPIYWDGERYRYVDDDRPTAEHWRNRPCGECGRHFTPEGHDPCLGTLPDVANACCGHGEVRKAYVQFNDGAELRGGAALAHFNLQRLARLMRRWRKR